MNNKNQSYFIIHAFSYALQANILSFLDASLLHHIKGKLFFPFSLSSLFHYFSLGNLALDVPAPRKKSMQTKFYREVLYFLQVLQFFAVSFLLAKDIREQYDLIYHI
jgi:hypothetical protein